MRRALAAFVTLLSFTGCSDPQAGPDDEADDSGSETTAGATESGDSGETTEATTEDDTSTTQDDTTETTETTGEGLPNGSTCTADDECVSGNCYVIPFLGGQCGECNEDADCANTTGGGCTMHNPLESTGSICNMGELEGGCESSEVCMDGLVCGTVLDLLGLIQIDTCGNCEDDSACSMGQICAPLVEVMEFSGANDCIDPNTLAQDSFCNLGSGDMACESGICSAVDIMGLAMIGACGECNTDDDCMAPAVCVPGDFDIDLVSLTGSTCQ